MGVVIQLAVWNDNHDPLLFHFLIYQDIQRQKVWEQNRESTIQIYSYERSLPQSTNLCAKEIRQSISGLAIIILHSKFTPVNDLMPCILLAVSLQ